MPAIEKAFRSNEEEREKRIEEAQEMLEPLEKELQNKLFFGGDKIGFVDIVGLVIPGWMHASQEAAGFEVLTIHKFPNLNRWIQDYLNHSVAKEVLPQKDFLVAFLSKVVFGRNN